MKKCQDKRLPSVFSISHVPFMMMIYFLTFLGFSFFYGAFPMHALKQIRVDISSTGNILFFFERFDDTGPGSLARLPEQQI